MRETDTRLREIEASFDGHEFGFMATELLALRFERAKLEVALREARPFVNLAVTAEQAEASARWHSKALSALAAIDAALEMSGGVR